MSSKPAFVAHVAAQMEGAGELVRKAMFGEYGIYCDGKLIVLVCDDHAYLKPTPEGRALIPDAPEASPYPGAKPCLVLDGVLGDPDLMRELAAATSRALPAPKPKRAKKPKVP
ncbi:MAG: tfoX [Cyanobacteria bacterium RYN_339]|nr:tfoX [Cyanobacteria bacterium RYN_339]